MIQAFTGPSRMTKTQWMWAAQRIAALEPVADVWRSGCAPGLDTLAAYITAGFAAYDGELQLFVPHANHNATLVRELAAQNVRIVRCPGRDSVSATMRLRNEWMIRGAALTFDGVSARDEELVGVSLPAHRLHAFVREETFYRSGEWMTINIAERFGIEVVKDVLPREAGG